MFMVLSSWQNHCESSPGSFDECKTAPSSRRPSDQANDLGCESACKLPRSTSTIAISASNMRGLCELSSKSNNEEHQLTAQPRHIKHDTCSARHVADVYLYPGRAGPDRAGPGRAGPDRAGPGRPGLLTSRWRVSEMNRLTTHWRLSKTSNCRVSWSNTCTHRHTVGLSTLPSCCQWCHTDRHFLPAWVVHPAAWRWAD